jgi:YbbR domain-containing protein
MKTVFSHPAFRNWHLKLFSLVLATALWAAVASDPMSEIGVSVPIEYRNIPHQTEIVGDTQNRVEIRLRGPSSLVRGLQQQDISISIDMNQIPLGQEKVFPLTTEHIRAPFGVEVVRAVPARVRVTLEQTTSKSVRLQPAFDGELRGGFELEQAIVTPASVDIEGPESHIRETRALPTTPIDLTGRRETFTQEVDLDISDPYVRVPKTAPVQVEVRIRRSR